jgi:putative ABC transport system permease protein
VNLTVLALVALFTGAFLVFSVLALSVAQARAAVRAAGRAGPDGRASACGWCWWSRAVLGLAGSAAGIAWARRWRRWRCACWAATWAAATLPAWHRACNGSGAAALLYGLLGVAALAGGWWPARARKTAPAQTLKGLGAAPSGRANTARALLLMAAGVLLAQAPRWRAFRWQPMCRWGCCWWAASRALPWADRPAADRLAPWPWRAGCCPCWRWNARAACASSAAVAVSGVVASLSLAVALTVMVASFRGSVTQWLDVVLPADLYVRTAMGTGRGRHGPSAARTSCARWPGCPA